MPAKDVVELGTEIAWPGGGTRIIDFGLGDSCPAASKFLWRKQKTRFRRSVKRVLGRSEEHVLVVIGGLEPPTPAL